MKTLLAVLIAATAALSFGAKADSCRVIGANVVNQYVDVARFKVETPAQIEAYNGLVDSQVTACQRGLSLRKKGASPVDIHKIIRGAMSELDKPAALVETVPSASMTVLSLSYGYSFGE